MQGKNLCQVIKPGSQGHKTKNCFVIGFKVCSRNWPVSNIFSKIGKYLRPPDVTQPTLSKRGKSSHVMSLYRKMFKHFTIGIIRTKMLFDGNTTYCCIGTF